MFVASSRSQFIEQPSFVDDPSTLAFAGRDRHRPHGPRATARRPQRSPSPSPFNPLVLQQPRQGGGWTPAQRSSPSRTADDAKTHRPTAALSPRSLVTDLDDPAFSVNPNHHPDHNHGLGLGLHLGATNAPDILVSRQPRVDSSELIDSDGLPTYEESISSDQDRQERQNRDLNSLSNENLSVIVTPASPSVRSISFAPPEEEGTDLPYLRDVTQRNSQERLSSSSPVAHQTPLLPPGVQAPMNSSRRASEPPRVSPEPRPQIAPRGFTSPPTRTAELDRIDEMDESGLGLHHRGPYEMHGRLIAPPRRALPFQRDHEPLSSIQNLGSRPMNLNDPPLPVPFKLNLQPGQVLPRLSPEHVARIQRNSLSPTSVYAPQAQMAPSRSRSSSGRTLPKDPENIIYYDATNSPSPGFPIPSPAASRMNSRRPSPSSSNSASNENVDCSASSPPMPEPEITVRFGRHSSYEPTGTRPVFQHTPSVVSAPTVMTTRSNVDGPVRGAGLHLPRQLVMPTPLQQQAYNPSHVTPTEKPSPVNNFIPSPPPPAHAASIPMHQSKKGNMLKKRTTISGSNPSERTNASAPPPKTKSFRLSLAVPPVEPPAAEKERRLPRRLSKRRNV